MASILPPAKTTFFYPNGDPLALGKVYFYIPGSLTAKTTWQDLDATIPNTNPVSLDADGRALIVGIGRYRQIVEDPLGNQIWDQVTGDVSTQAYASVAVVKALPNPGAGADGLRVDLIGYYGVGTRGGGPLYWDADSTETEDLITIFAPNTGGTGRWKRLLDGFVTAGMAGATGDGATNDTTALLRFYNYMIAAATYVIGVIEGGTYLVTPGQLNFDCGYVDTTFPYILTAGSDRTVFRVAASVDAAILKFTNGTATSGVFEGWLGGYHGGITIDDNTGDVAPNRHGLVLRGLIGTSFGYMRFDDVRGDAVQLENKQFGGNPDPYNVGGCIFEGIEANRARRWAFNNDNIQGFTGCKIGFLRAIECGAAGGGGVWHGLGAGNIVDRISVGTCKGWAIDDIPTAGGSSVASRAYVGIAEFDDVQNGIRLQTAHSCSFRGIRFKHRYNFNPAFNPGEGYWPRTCVDLGPNASPSVSNIQFDLQHETVAGGLKADFGVILQLNAAGGNLVNITVHNKMTDTAGLGFVDTDFYTGTTANTAVRVYREDRTVLDTYRVPHGLFRGSAGTSLGALANDPITTTNGSAIVTVAIAGHGLVVGQVVVLQGSAAVNGITAAQLNSGFPVTSVVDANNITITAAANATASGSGGGAGVTATKDQTFINESGFGTLRCKTAFPTALVDSQSGYSTTLYEYTAEYTGLYEIFATMAISGLAAGNRVRLAIYKNVHTAPAVVLTVDHRCQGANRETINLYGYATLTVGDKLSVQTDNNSGASVAPNITSASADLIWGVKALGRS